MRILVTGGTGFIGRHLCQRLVERGDHVVALVRSKRKASALPAQVETLEGDVAAERPEEYEAINFTAVKDLVECVGRQAWKPARFLFASSLAAAGPSCTLQG